MRSPAPRILGAPRSVRVAADGAGVPQSLEGKPVASVRDEWRVDEGWWTGRPVRRRYFDVVLADGRNAVIFCDHRTGRWSTQRG
jgi:hypothetical protein